MAIACERAEHRRGRQVSALSRPSSWSISTDFFGWIVVVEKALECGSQPGAQRLVVL
jgi:hypothetical protein